MRQNESRLLAGQFDAPSATAVDRPSEGCLPFPFKQVLISASQCAAVTTAVFIMLHGVVTIRSLVAVIGDANVVVRVLDELFRHHAVAPRKSGECPLYDLCRC